MRGARADVPLFDPDDDRFLRPGDMPALIAAACTEAGQLAPGRGEIVRSALTSLACSTGSCSSASTWSPAGMSTPCT